MMPQNAKSRLEELPVELLRRVAELLPEAEVVFSFKVACKHIYNVLGDYRIVRVSPGVVVPSHAIDDWWRRTRAASASSLTITQRQAIVLQAAKLGDLAVLQQVISAMDCLVTTDLLKDCARSGFLTGCEHLIMQYGNGDIYWTAVLVEAAMSGNLELVKWVLQREKADYPYLWSGEVRHEDEAPTDALVKAAEAGHRDVCEELLRVSSSPQVDRLAAAAAAARGGHVAMMDGLLVGGPWEGSLHSVVVGAAKGCDLATLQRLFYMYKEQPAETQQQEQQQQRPRCKMLAAAVVSATPDSHTKAQWLLQQRHPKDARCSSLKALAALPDAAERVRWMRREGIEFLGTASLTQAAARKGHLPLLTALLDCGAVFSDDDVRAAADEGHTAWLQELHARDGRIPQEAIHDAARAGHTGLVQWLWGVLGLGREVRSAKRAGGAKGARAAAHPAAGGGGAAGAAKKLREKVLSSAAASGNRELAAWVLGNTGREWGSVGLGDAVACGCLGFMEWLPKQGCPMDEDFPYVKAARNGDLAMLRWLKRRNCPYYNLNSYHRELEDDCPVSVRAVEAWFRENGLPTDWLQPYEPS